MATNAEIEKKLNSIVECIEAWNTPQELKADIAALSSDVAKLSNLPSDVKAINVLLTGNGDPPKGLVVRVDRIEQRFLVMGLIIIPAISGIVSWVVSHALK